MKNNLFKIFTALLISTYVFSTVGFSVIEHYCGGELEDVAIFSKPKSCCGGDEDISEDGCCKNKESHIAFHKDFTFKVFTKKLLNKNSVNHNHYFLFLILKYLNHRIQVHIYYFL